MFLDAFSMGCLKVWEETNRHGTLEAGVVRGLPRLSLAFSKFETRTTSVNRNYKSSLPLDALGLSSENLGETHFCLLDFPPQTSLLMSNVHLAFITESRDSIHYHWFILKLNHSVPSFVLILILKSVRLSFPNLVNRAMTRNSTPTLGCCHISNAANDDFSRFHPIQLIHPGT
jgi:hypothetical protein